METSRVDGETLGGTKTKTKHLSLNKTSHKHEETSGRDNQVMKTIVEKIKNPN